MKFILFIFLANISLSLSSFSQDLKEGQVILVTVKPDSAKLYVNGIEVFTPFRARANNANYFYVAKKRGCINQGFTYAELAKKGKRKYTIELEKSNPLPAGYSSKLIEVYKLIDKTDKSIKVNLGDTYFTTSIGEKMIAYGYKNIVNADLFDTQQWKTQLKLAGEVININKNTIGSGFQIGVKVNWSVYDVVENKIIFQLSSAGMSDTKANFQNEFALALKNALLGLMGNAEFQRIAQQVTVENTK